MKSVSYLKVSGKFSTPQGKWRHILSELLFVISLYMIHWLPKYFKGNLNTPRKIDILSESIFVWSTSVEEIDVRAWT